MKNISINCTATIRSKFERFAEEECKGNSPLYYQLSRQIAADDELLSLCTFVRNEQPVPNAFLAAIHFFVLTNRQAELAQYYPSVKGQRTQEIPFEMFRSFVDEHKEGIADLLRHRIVQTNVITRCNYLLPVFSRILSRENRPATIIDIGTSAGLTLNFDHYEYHYNGEKVYGSSPVQLQCIIKEGKIPVIEPIANPIHKIGIDQHIIDFHDADDLTWLQALVWPDQLERFSMMKEALSLPALSEINLVQGSSIDDFRKVIEQADDDHALIVYATHALYQFPPQLLDAFYRLLDDIGRSRDFYFLSAESTKTVQLKYGIDNAAVVLATYKKGRKEEICIAETNGHGNWIKWK